MFFDRTISAGSANARKRPAQTVMFPAPKAGLTENDNIANPNAEGAQALDNFYPSTDGARLRRGTELHATIDTDGTDEVRWMDAYEFGATSQLFAANATSIFDVTSPASATVEPTPVITGQSNGNYTSDQFSTAGGHFLMMVNGVDDMLGYDGSYWYNVSTAGVDILLYDGQTEAFAADFSSEFGSGTFTAGETLTGGASGHTATIQRVYDNGTTGALLITGKTGVFQNDETITGSGGGTAVANGTATAGWPAITGVDTSAISHIWHHKSRIWMVEEGTFSVWYLATDARSGTATEFPLKGVFHEGGSLLFGATWSLDSGSGLDDVCLFVTTEGEIAVYQGTDPSSASTWSLVGVYQMGRPLHKNAWFHAGGDIAVTTDDGIVPISVAVREDRAALTGKAVTYPIEDRWRRYVRAWGESEKAFEVIHWQQEAMLLVSMPKLDGEADFCLVANSRTGAWARFTGYDARVWGMLGNRCFFGTSTGTIVECEIGGKDVGDAAYVGRWVPRFTSQKAPYCKQALHARVLAVTDRTFEPQLFAMADFSQDWPSAGSATVSDADDVWGTGIWDESEWGVAGDTFTGLTSWQGVAAVGCYLVPGVHIVSGTTAAHSIQLAAMWLQYEEGNPF